MKYIILAFILTGCVEVPDDITVNHGVNNPIIDQCKDHYGYRDIDIFNNLLTCNDGAEFDLVKGEL